MWGKVFLLIFYGAFSAFLYYVLGKRYIIKKLGNIAADPFYIGTWCICIIAGIFMLYLWISTGEFVKYAFSGVTLITLGLTQLFIIWHFSLK
jgi:hypothetical protein